MTKENKPYKLVDFDKWEVGAEYECVEGVGFTEDHVYAGQHVTVIQVCGKVGYAPHQEGYARTDTPLMGAGLWCLSTEDRRYFKKVVREEGVSDDVHSADIIINLTNGTTLALSQLKDFDKTIGELITPKVDEHKKVLEERKVKADMKDKLLNYNIDDLVELLLREGVKL
ncbi:hypothetical protein NVP1170O_005 [Vibrio phage 1.170.O._10N.261.52.C3]|nr:hypothetical protein NVP1170O_005 [Vibrio phage 1.170.O._10N.261.52.C3]